MKKSTRPFAFKIVAAEFFAAVHKIPLKDRGPFITQFVMDLVTLDPLTDFGKQIVSETVDFIKQQSEYGKSGGAGKHRHPKGSLKAPLRLPKGSPYPEVELEVELEKELEVKEERKEKVKKKTLKPLSEYSDDFITFWKSYPKKTAKGAAWLEWKKHQPPLEKVLSSLEWQKVSRKWQEGFILDPERYIKKRCWEDEPTDSIVSDGYASRGVMGALQRSAELRRRAQQQEVLDVT